jgi:preprotein translocase subunit Sec61beta
MKFMPDFSYLRDIDFITKIYKTIEIKQKNMKEIFAVISLVLMLIGTIWYDKETKNKKIKPNIVVFFAMFFINLLNAITYIFIVEDLYKAGLLITTGLSTVWIIIATMKSKNYLFKKSDIIFILLGSCATALLLIIFQKEYLHIIMQILITIPFIPLIAGIIKKEGKEPIYPWLLMLAAVVFNLFAVLVEYSGYWSLIHPLRSLFCLGLLIISILIAENKIKLSW